MFSRIEYLTLKREAKRLQSVINGMDATNPPVTVESLKTTVRAALGNTVDAIDAMLTPASKRTTNQKASLAKGGV